MKKNNSILYIKNSLPNLNLRYKPDNASKYLPSWFKKLSKNISFFPNPSLNYDSTAENRSDTFSYTIATIKKCPSVFQYLYYGLVIPLWDDFKLTYNQNYNIKFSTETTVSYVNNHLRVSLVSPWIFSSDKTIEFYCEKNLYHFEHPTIYDVVPKLVTVKGPTKIDIDLLFPLSDNDYEIIIPAGTPILHMLTANTSFTLGNEKQPECPFKNLFR